MNQPHTASGAPIETGALSLGEVRELSPASRCASILQLGERDLTAVLEALRREGAAIPSSLDAGRLAWAIACNAVGPTPSSGENPAARARRCIRSYSDRWPARTPWTTIWSALTKPLSEANPGPAASLLGELALSVACEQRGDWQPPAARSIDPAAAGHAFEFLYSRNQAKVVGDVFSHFGSRADNPETIADEAWSRVFCDYWSAQARRRFLGLCRISTLVCQVARYVATDMLRERQRFVATGDGQGDPENPGPSLEEIGIFTDPTENIAAKQLRARIHACMSSLPAKQQIVATMVWFRGVSAKRAAEVLKVSEPAISQHLKKARENVRACLAAQGLKIIR